MCSLLTHSKYDQVECRVSADLPRVVVDGVNLRQWVRSTSDTA